MRTILKRLVLKPGWRSAGVGIHVGIRINLRSSRFTPKEGILCKRALHRLSVFLHSLLTWTAAALLLLPSVDIFSGGSACSWLAFRVSMDLLIAPSWLGFPCFNRRLRSMWTCGRDRHSKPLLNYTSIFMCTLVLWHCLILLESLPEAELAAESSIHRSSRRC